MLNLEEISEKSDEDLVSLTLNNQDYFVFLVNRYKNKLDSYIKRITNVRDEDAEDLLQEVFLKVYLNLNAFEADMKFSSWVYAVTRNQVISHHRKVSVRPEGHSLPLDDEISKKISSSTDIENKIDQKYLKDNFYEALSKLHFKYQEVLILKFLEDKNYQEISDIIKKPVGTVGSMINKAKKDLKKQIIKFNIKI